MKSKQPLFHTAKVFKIDDLPKESHDLLMKSNGYIWYPIYAVKVGMASMRATKSSCMSPIGKEQWLNYDEWFINNGAMIDEVVYVER